MYKINEIILVSSLNNPTKGAITPVNVLDKVTLLNINKLGKLSIRHISKGKITEDEFKYD